MCDVLEAKTDHLAHAAWALGRIDDLGASAGLAEQLTRETDDIVRRQIAHALGEDG